VTIEADFVANRPQLIAVAFRLLGSIQDAEDAVQTAWIKASAVDPRDIRNVGAWLTTVTTRICLDQLRARSRHGEQPLDADLISADMVLADENYLQREHISRALMVVLERLTPAQRVAYVLHDIFDVPFDDVALTLHTSVDSAKQHASRARRRIENSQPPDAANDVARSVADAFLAAAAGADFDRMLALMTTDCVRVVDPALVPPGTAAVVTGARAIAEETSLFADRIRACVPMVVDGRPIYVIAPGGHLLATLEIGITDRRVSRIDIARAAANL
jgi:RNA polymerase sigma-70 factor (ECF subfamily)